MPSCSRLVSLLLDYLEERLPAEVRADLEGHLARCPNCVAYVRTYRSTVSLLHSLKEDDLPPELRTTLHAFLDRRTRN
jgi:anti-sigma factor RsiW